MIPSIILASLLICAGTHLRAASITVFPDAGAGGDGLGPGIGYTFGVNLAETDSGSFASHVGAWSWEDQNVAPEGGKGWTHTSNWVALTLLAPAKLTLTLSPNSTVPYVGSGNVGGFAAIDNFFPGATLYQNWDNDGSDLHIYENTTNVSWAEDLTYLAHLTTTTDHSITGTWTLAAGQYTLALGSNSPAIANPPRQGYTAIFNTVPVPEPAMTGLLLLTCLGLLRRQRA